MELHHYHFEVVVRHGDQITHYSRHELNTEAYDKLAELGYNSVDMLITARVNGRTEYSVIGTEQRVSVAIVDRSLIDWAAVRLARDNGIARGAVASASSEGIAFEFYSDHMPTPEFRTDQETWAWIDGYRSGWNIHIEGGKS